MHFHMEERHAEGQSPFVVVGNADMPHASRALSSRGTGSGHDRLHATPGPAVGLRNEAEAEAGPLYAECPIDGCRELVAAVEMDYHLELHVEEAAGKESDTATAAATASAETTNANSLTVQLQRKPVGRHSRASSREEGAELDGLEPVHVQARERPDRDSGALQEGPADCPRLSKRQRAILESRNIFKMLFTPSSSSVSSRRQPLGPGTGSSSGTHSPLGTPSKRLGKAQLGKYWDEARMPDWLIDHLRNHGQVRAEGVIPVLLQLLSQSPCTKYAFLCHPDVVHVSKLKREGGFCGYRNIQMMSSYITAVGFNGSQRLGKRIPSIFQIQDFIECAWDHGISPQGREETGGIKDTRKYIGTPEALAMFRLLDIPCTAQGFRHEEPGRSEALLLDGVENYFRDGASDPTARVQCTKLPPIYFQHAGHSMTIIGFEKQRNGARNLLVFDPMFRDSTHITKLTNRRFKCKYPDTALKAYRRGNKYLQKYREFETLSLRPPPGGFKPL
ncbi:hypothetical protein P8C59_004164 [Phyllachora maydis]|uniref:UFSP1/2/DUB catalytic domain-containing protein n=1 Tax=Phyllachora maydis TaxID=1825666 RepID=A0AAD9MB15_9PEZI|nr:hypothetical protein P8C59_004164 [Phyllachora maydis]